MIMKCSILVDVEKAKEWIKSHRDTRVDDTPLWVLVSLGVMVLEEDENDKRRSI